MNAKQEADSAFSRVDLLVVIAVIALLALLWMPALGRTRVNDQAFVCLNNLRQLLNAWRMYAEDNADALPSAWGFTATDWIPIGGAWMSWSGNPQTDGSNTCNWDVNLVVKKSLLWPYCGNNPDIWRCPGDDKYPCIAPSGPYAGQPMLRQRSYSMLDWFNSTDADAFGGPGVYVKYKKISDVLKPGPQMTFVFLDERCDSINDGEFVVSMQGWPSQPASWTMVDFPASYHGGSGSFAFVDGHVESHQWRDARTTPPIGKLPGLNVPSPNNPDVYWLMEHSTRKP
jgi:prepilin-type processing-associated H-X9-DG protein